MRIAAAQSISIAGDVAANVRRHARFIAVAQAAGVDLLVFPELSLSGYELPLLQSCQLTPQAPCLAPLRAQVASGAMRVIVGAPLVSTSDLPSIGAISLLTDGSSSIYRKQYLHQGEEQFVVAADVLSQPHALLGEVYALAICADCAQPQHAASAAASGASLYLASVLVSEAGYTQDSSNLQRYAKDLNMAVLMANHGGPTGGYRSAGKSAFWAPGGELIVTAAASGNQLLIADNTGGQWQGQLLTLND